MRTHTLITVSIMAMKSSGVRASRHGSPFGRRAVPQIPGYDYAGCYTEAAGQRALNGSSYFDDRMTIEKCASACTGFPHFGLEYGRECYCGNTINAGSVIAPAGDCSFTCPGDSTQTCGAGNRLTLYTRSVSAPIPTTYGYRGCFAEPEGGGRALPNLFQRSENMTVSTCASFCRGAGYTLFGLEYYHECFCGHTLTAGTQPAPETDCRYPCSGNSQEKCGGDLRLNVYQFGLASPTISSTLSTSSASTTSTTTPTSTQSANPVNYASQGCYTEAQGIRALSDFAYYNDSMTVALCATACSGYSYFGVEYGRECFCGNKINTANGSTPTILSECSFPCPGNPAEFCGAGNRLNLYRFLPTESSATSESTSSPSTEQASISSSSVPTSSSSAVVPTSTTTFILPLPTASSSSTSSSVAPSTSSATGSDTPSSSFSSSSSSSSTGSSPSSASAPPAPTNVLKNADFEGTDGWTIKTPGAPGALSYSFVNANGPHGGLRSASVSYSAGASAYQAWFNQVVTLTAGKRYIFSGWTRASTTNPGCSVAYYVGSASGTSVVNLRTLAQAASANLRPQWTQSTGFFDVPGPAGQGATAADYTFNVRWTCASGAAAKTYYVDDLSLVATS